MKTVVPTSEPDWAAELAAERARREQAEAALAGAEHRIGELEGKIAQTDSDFRHHYTQLEALVQGLRVGLVLVSQQGQIQFVNQYFWDLFDLPPVAPPEEGGAIAPDAIQIARVFLDPADFTKRVWAMQEAGQTVLQEEFLLADGRIVELDYLVLDSKQAGRLICYRDVTERRQRDNQLHVLAYIPEQNPNPTLRLADTGEIIYANPATGPFLYEHARQGGLQHLVQAALQTSVLHQQELAVAGQQYLCTAVAVPGQRYVTLYLTNITARYQVEQQLAEQRIFYENTLEQVPTAVAVFDAGPRYLFVNLAAEPDPIVRAWMLGRTSEEVCQYRQLSPTIVRQRQAAFAQAVAGRGEVTWREVRPGEAAAQRHLLLRLWPVFAPNGALQMMISSGIDITELNRAEEEISRQQEFYESILNLLPVDVAVFDADYRFVFVNPSSVPDPAVREQIIGMSSAEYFAFRQRPQHAELAAQRDQYFDLAVRTRTDVTWEEMRTDHNQRPQLMLRHLRPIFDANGALRLVVGSGIDITARYTAEKLQHQVQEMLRAQQAFIRQVLDAVPNMLYMVGPGNRVTFSNKAYNTLTAHSQHVQANGASPAVQEEMRQIQLLNEQVRNTRQAITRELPFTLTTGEILYLKVHKSPLLSEDGQLGVFTINTDITALKKARQELEQRAKQYHDLVYYSPALICTHDLQGQVLSVNPAIERLMGVPAAQLVGRSLHEALPPQHYDRFRAYLGAAEPQQLPEERTMTVRLPNGAHRYLRYFTYRVTAAGHTPYVVASGYDVTAEVLARRELEHAKREAANCRDESMPDQTG